MRLARYVALGDSMSIDVYPGLDHAERNDVEPPLDGLGAASLLFRNHDEAWPEFVGRDLVNLYPGIEHEVHAADGATTEDVLALQLTRVQGSDLPTLVTLTAGGNDLLGILGRAESAGVANQRIVRALDNVRDVLNRLKRLFPRGHVICATVYDPSDGLGTLEHLTLTPEVRGLLARYNDAIRALNGPDVGVVDLERHFAGHGASAPAAERWYWCQLMIEPGCRGACEIRRLWLTALRDPA